jgi:hypothetical protein
MSVENAARFALQYEHSTPVAAPANGAGDKADEVGCAEDELEGSDDSASATVIGVIDTVLNADAAEFCSTVPGCLVCGTYQLEEGEGGKSTGA